MSKRMTATAFSYIQKQHPDEMLRLEIEVSDFTRFKYRRRRKNAKPKKKKTSIQKYGEQLSSIIEWLDANANEPYFPRLVQDQRLSWDTKIEFYFIDEGDAMAFKLMFS